MIAQEVKEVFPQAILGSEESVMGLDPLTLISALVKAVQELTEKVNALENPSVAPVKKRTTK